MMNRPYKKKGKLVLGINGWFEQGHDAAAAIIDITEQECKILGALEEEKVTREKCAYDCLPLNALAELLKYLQLEVSDLDQVVFGWDYPLLYQQKNRFGCQDIAEIFQIKEKLFSNYKFDKPLSFVNHHLSHASSAYRTSPFQHALILVLDGQGEEESASIWIGKGDKLDLLRKFDINVSLGYLYEAVNETLGFRNHESGKTMGLAAYGEPTYTEELKGCFDFSDDGYSLGPSMKKYYQLGNRLSGNDLDEQKKCISMWSYFFYEKLKIKKRQDSIVSFYHVEKMYCDLAASVQKLLEDTAVKLLDFAIKQTGIHDICIGGGVGLNCKMNGVILSQEFVHQLYVHPASNDAGVSLGAALEWAYKNDLSSRPCDYAEFSPYLGIEYSDEEIVKMLEQKGIPYEIVDNASKWIALQIANNHIVALFQGRNEWGPRALGNRTILANAQKKENLDYINSKVKKRECGRPLGPSLLQEDGANLGGNFKVYGNYMNLAYYSKNKENHFPAVIHVDNTFRPQFVSKNSNLLYYQQLKEIQEHTDTSIVINTSFNLSTPIIYHIEDAIDYFLTERLNSLVFNNHIILEHKRQEKLIGEVSC